MITAFVRTLILYILIMAGLRLLGKRQIGTLNNGNTFQRTGRIGIHGMNRGSHPFFRIETVLRRIAQEIAEQFASQIDTECPVPFKEHRALP